MRKIECSALRCIAIICIMIHNYAHKLPGAAKRMNLHIILKMITISGMY